jgi:hypothetical protein
VFDGETETPLMGFFAYSAEFAGGVFVAASPLEGFTFCDATAEVITGAGSGGGPHVRGFKRQDDGTPDPLIGFFAFEGTFGGGAQVGGNLPHNPSAC